MGRTNPTFRLLLRGIEDRWQAYRRALRRADQYHFDRLFEHADAHADAAGYLNYDDPMIPVLVSIVLEQEKRIERLEQHCSSEGDRHRDSERDRHRGSEGEQHRSSDRRRPPGR